MKDWQKNREREKTQERVSFYLETYFTLSSYVLNSGADLKTWISRIFKVFDERYFLFCFSNVSPTLSSFRVERHFSCEEQVQHPLCRTAASRLLKLLPNCPTFHDEIRRLLWCDVAGGLSRHEMNVARRWRCNIDVTSWKFPACFARKELAGRHRCQSTAEH